MERDRGPENVKQDQAKKGAKLKMNPFHGFCFWMISIFKKITLMGNSTLKFREINQQL